VNSTNKSAHVHLSPIAGLPILRGPRSLLVSRHPPKAAKDLGNSPLHWDAGHLLWLNDLIVTLMARLHLMLFPATDIRPSGLVCLGTYPHAALF
jgi:hypothetical protein